MVTRSTRGLPSVPVVSDLTHLSLQHSTKCMVGSLELARRNPARGTLRGQVDRTRDAHGSCGGELLGDCCGKERVAHRVSVTVLAPGALGAGQLRVCGLGADGRGVAAE